MRPLAALAFAALLLSAGAPAFAQIRPDADAAAFRATTLSLSATGDVKARPDMATLSLGVDTQGRTAGEALARNRERMNATLAALRAQGLAERDLQTSDLSLAAQYTSVPHQAPRISGYDATNSVTVTVRDLSRLGGVVDAVVASGANNVGDIGFGLQNPRAAQDEARRAAVVALQARAELYAQAIGRRIGRLVNLTETGGSNPGPVRRMFRAEAQMTADAAAPTPVAPGELAIKINVSAVYELTQ